MTANNDQESILGSSVNLDELTEITDALLDEAFQFDLSRPPMSLDERIEQEVSFVWGNALESDRGTIEAVRKHLKLISI